MPVNIHEAKTHLSRLIERVLSGEEIIISRGGTPVAKLVPLDRRTARRAPGTARGRYRMSDDFDTWLPDELRREFE